MAEGEAQQESEDTPKRRPTAQPLAPGGRGSDLKRRCLECGTLYRRGKLKCPECGVPHKRVATIADELAGLGPSRPEARQAFGSQTVLGGSISIVIGAALLYWALTSDREGAGAFRDWRLALFGGLGILGGATAIVSGFRTGHIVKRPATSREVRRRELAARSAARKSGRGDAPRRARRSRNP